MRFLFLFLLLTGCTAVNVDGNIDSMSFHLKKDGRQQELKVDAKATKCPVLESEFTTEKGKYSLKVKCKTLIR